MDREKLIEDIMTDVDVARASLERQGYETFKEDGYLVEFAGEEHGGEVAS